MMLLQFCVWIFVIFILVNFEVLKIMGVFLVQILDIWGFLNIVVFKGIDLEIVLKIRD